MRLPNFQPCIAFIKQRIEPAKDIALAVIVNLLQAIDNLLKAILIGFLVGVSGFAAFYVFVALYGWAR